MTTCTTCQRRTATHGEQCGPCAVAAQTVLLGRNEGRTYEAQPHMVHGLTTHWEVYEQSSEGRRFFSTLQQWPNTAAYRRIGAVASPDGLRREEGV